MEEKGNNINLVSIWKTEDGSGAGSEWHSSGIDDIFAIIMSICDFAKKNNTFMLLLLGALADCLRGGEFSQEINKSSIDISNFYDIFKNTNNNG